MPYNALKLQLCKKTPKRQVETNLREDRTDANQPNQICEWILCTIDLLPAEKLRILTIVDSHPRYAPAITLPLSRRRRSSDGLKGLPEAGYSQTIRVDNSTELVTSVCGRISGLWFWPLSRQGKPTDNE